jgi:hypothetical protein
VKIIKIACLVFLCCLSENLMGQDIVLTRKQETLKTKILEIDDQNVKYKRFDFLDGPTFSIKKSDILLIIYSNGLRETFDTTEATAGSSSSSSSRAESQSRNRAPEAEEENEPAPPARNSQKNRDLNSGSDRQRNSGDPKLGQYYLALVLGTGGLLTSTSPGYSGASSLPSVSVRVEKLFKVFNPDFSLNLGTIHSVTGIVGTAVVSNGVSGTAFYKTTDKITLAGGVRLQYNYLIPSSVGNLNLGLFVAAYFNSEKRIKYFVELSSGYSNINVGARIPLK